MAAQKAAILAQVGHFYFGEVGQYYFGANKSQAVAELKGVRDVLPLFRCHLFFADDQNVAEADLEAFASLKQSLWEWNALASDIPETDLIKGAQDYLEEIRSFEARGYVVKSGTSARHRRDGSAVPMAILVAFRKAKGTAGTPDEVWLPKKMSVGFWN